MYLKNIILACVSLFFMSGCAEEAIQGSYDDMCDRDKDSIMCYNQKVTGIDLGREYLAQTLKELYGNYSSWSDMTQYGIEDYWTHNDTVSEKLRGDCEDFAMTFISHIILDGFSADKVRLIISGANGEVKHAYVKVSLEDGSEFTAFYGNNYEDMAYMQLDNVGKFTKF